MRVRTRATPTRRWLLLTVVAAALLLITLDNSILFTALPRLTEELGATGQEGLWIINSYPLVTAGLLLGAGTLGDRVGHKRMFLAGLAIFGAASLFAAFSPTPLLLIAARALLAVGAASMMPATLALIRVTFVDERERNIAISVWGSVAVIGSALGPILSGLLLEVFWWGSVFLINVPVVILALIAGSVLAPAGGGDPAKRWDFLSSVQVMIGLVALVVAIKEFAHLPPSPVVVVVALICSALGFTFFARRQRVLRYPLLEFAIFRNPAFVAGLIGAGLSMFAIAGMQLLTAQRFQLVAGFTPLEAGLLVAVVALGALPTALLGGAILHRTGLLPLVAGGLLLGASGALIVALSFSTGSGWMIVGLAILGAGTGATMSVASTAIVGNAPVSRAGMASSVEEVSYEFGSLTAVAVLGSVAAAVYSATIDLPVGVADRARDGLVQAVDIARGSGADGAALLASAGSAYDGAYTVVMVVVCAVLAAGAIGTAVLLRRHGPGSKSTEYNSH